MNSERVKFVVSGSHSGTESNGEVSEEDGPGRKTYLTEINEGGTGVRTGGESDKVRPKTWPLVHLRRHRFRLSAGGEKGHPVQAVYVNLRTEGVGESPLVRN